MNDCSANAAPERTVTPGCMAALKRIGALIRHDPGQRGLATLAGQDDLPRAAASLLRSERIFIVTGFCIRAAMIGENDGPPGALALADALRQLGREVIRQLPRPLVLGENGDHEGAVGLWGSVFIDLYAVFI